MSARVYVFSVHTNVTSVDVCMDRTTDRQAYDAGGTQHHSKGDGLLAEALPSRAPALAAIVTSIWLDGGKDQQLHRW